MGGMAEGRASSSPSGQCDWKRTNTYALLFLVGSAADSYSSVELAPSTGAAGVGAVGCGTEGERVVISLAALAILAGPSTGGTQSIGWHESDECMGFFCLGTKISAEIL